MMLFGSDKTQSWRFWHFSSTEVVGMLGALFILVVTFAASRGVDKIAKVASVGGIFALTISILFSLLSIVVLIIHHGILFESISGANNFLRSPNASFQSLIAIISFLVYAIFVFAGLETTSGVIDSVDRPEKIYPKALVTAMLLMTSLYIVMIVMCGFSTVLRKSNVNLANCEYVIINNLGAKIGKVFGMSAGISLVFAHLAELTDVLAEIGGAFMMVYSSIKSFVLGYDTHLLPKKLTKLNDKGIPANAMWMQPAHFCRFNRYDECVISCAIPVPDRGVPIL